MSCLFQSIGECLGMSHARVRQEILDYMQRHSTAKFACAKEEDSLPFDQLVQLSENKSLTEYILEMQKSSTWGGGIELATACLLYDMNITVHFDGKEIQLGSGTAAREIHINYNGSHYTAQL